jgi:cob(I)alamin adenosyltransferase
LSISSQGNMCGIEDVAVLCQKAFVEWAHFIADGREIMNGRVLLFTGEGKGKTTAAFGMALRAIGHGMKALVISFVKTDTQVGECAVCAALPALEVVMAGKGFLINATGSRLEAHRAAAQEGLRLAQEALASAKYGVVVLDEFCTAVAEKLIDLPQAVALLESRRPETHVVMTGRGACAELIALADTATEMRCIKHAYDAGIPAVKGVEF